ncbi:hypothetical protein CRUP_006070 [Coryphaenoides rupestris]|nr:hypothetical protein CRUP_006070 [Coryphaenoides rupestris]
MASRRRRSYRVSRGLTYADNRHHRHHHHHHHSTHHPPSSPPPSLPWPHHHHHPPPHPPGMARLWVAQDRRRDTGDVSLSSPQTPSPSLECTLCPILNVKGSGFGDVDGA